MGSDVMSLIREYIERKMSTEQYEQELIKLIKSYNQYRKTYLFVYAAGMNKNIPDVALQQDDYYTIADILKNKMVESLDFYIETPGGRGETAEEIVRFLRSRCSKLSYVVSGEAKSAGTIMVLSGDEILMTETGSLGPIDAQMRIGRSQISAKDYIEWVEEKHKEAGIKGSLNPFDATMIAQISPGEFKGVYQALEFAEDLVVEWLPKYKFKNWEQTETKKEPVTEEMKKERAREVASKLLNRKELRTHARSIKIGDLEGLLKIERIDDDPKLSDIVYRIQIICKLLFETTNVFKIFATEDLKIFRQASLMQIGGVAPQLKKVDVANAEVQCSKCGKKHMVYAKFIDNPKIDVDLGKKGFTPFPKGGKLSCDCGNVIDINGMKKELEAQIGRKIIINENNREDGN